MNIIMAESSCAALWDMAQAMKNDWGNPGKTGKCLITAPEMFCESVGKPTTTRNALKDGISGLHHNPEEPHEHFGLRLGQTVICKVLHSQRLLTNKQETKQGANSLPLKHSIFHHRLPGDRIQLYI